MDWRYSRGAAASGTLERRQDDLTRRFPYLSRAESDASETTVSKRMVAGRRRLLPRMPVRGDEARPDVTAVLLRRRNLRRHMLVQPLSRLGLL